MRQKFYTRPDGVGVRAAFLKKDVKETMAFSKSIYICAGLAKEFFGHDHSKDFYENDAVLPITENFLTDNKEHAEPFSEIKVSQGMGGEFYLEFVHTYILSRCRHEAVPTEAELAEDQDIICRGTELYYFQISDKVKQFFKKCVVENIPLYLEVK